MDHFLMEEFDIDTDHLRLLPLSIEELHLYLEHPAKLERSMALPISQSILSENLARAIKMKIERMSSANRGDHLWYTYWLIRIKGDGFGAGMVGFKGAPNLEGEVEIGYGIDPKYQGRGFMTEAVSALINWAFQHKECRSVIAPDTEKSNLASNRVLEKVGMQVYQETETTLSWRRDKL
jgi:ribosomal-protein-alanine N-acetyltransferase